MLAVSMQMFYVAESLYEVADRLWPPSYIDNLNQAEGIVNLSACKVDKPRPR